MSTLLPILAHWHAVLDLPESYEDFASEVRDVFSEVHLQMWYPGDDTDDHLYRTNAGQKSGMTLSPILLPEALSGLKKQIGQLNAERQEYKELSCIKHGLPIISLIASRHYRTPVLPVFWQDRVANDAGAQGETDAGETGDE